MRADRYEIHKEKAVQVAVKLAAILLGAVFLIWLVNRLIDRYTKRIQEAESGSAQKLFVLSFLKALFKVIIWLTTIVMTFSTLGFNIGAILAGLGIGGLAIAMASQETIANVLGGIMIFIERPFTIGDSVQIGACPEAKVIGMTWRSTRLRDGMDYYHSIPNNQVAKSPIVNYSTALPSMDWVTVYVSPRHDPCKINDLILEALAECKLIMQDKQYQFVRYAGVETVDNITLQKFWPCFYLEDYWFKWPPREEVWYKVWKRLDEAGIELAFTPDNIKEIKDPVITAKSLPES